MRQLDTKDLKEHLRTIKASTPEDRDEMLRDLLVLVYPTKISQDDCRDEHGAARGRGRGAPCVRLSGLR